MNISEDAGSERPGGGTSRPDQPTDRPDGTNGRTRGRPRHAPPALARPTGDDAGRPSTAPALSLRRVLARRPTAAGATAATSAPRDRDGDDTDEIVARPTPAGADGDTDETPAQPGTTHDDDRGKDTDEIVARPTPAGADGDTDETPARPGTTHHGDRGEPQTQPDTTGDATAAAGTAAAATADDDRAPATADTATTTDDDADTATTADADEDTTTTDDADTTTTDDADTTTTDADAAGAGTPAPAPTEVEPAPDREPPDAQPAPDRDPTAEPDRDATPDGRDHPGDLRQRIWAAVLLAVVAVVGSLPVLWVVGAVPWRQPTLLIENMFRGFTACALDGGVLHPIEMLCPRAGVPLGMYQLDGGLSYPLGGMLISAGVDPLAAWKWSVAALVVAGTGALFWLLRRLTGSPLVAMCFVAVYALGGPLTGRSWNWYWNITAAALLPIVLAAVYALYARAPERRLRRLAVPGTWLLVGVLAVSIEWQYAGLFATATAAGAMLLITLQLGWRWWQRPVLLLSTAVGLGVVVVLLRWRLTLAGIEEQFEDTIVTAGRFSVDVATFLVPDGSMTLIGELLAANGWDGRLVRSLVEGNQLWVAPYVGVLVLVFLLLVLVFRKLRLRPSPGRPRGFLLFLVLVTVACIALALGPIIRVAPLTQPSSVVDSPIGFLYATTPLQWIRYPWTWGYLLHVTLVVLYATLAVALLRRGPRRWSLLLVPLLVLLTLDFVSPQVLDAATDPEPSIALAPDWVRVDSADPAVVRFADERLPELRAALRGFDEPVVLFPWGNTWITPSLGPDVGVPVRNVGIDRNVHQVVDESPYGYSELKKPEPEVLRNMLDSGWASALVLLDHMPTSESILRFDHQHLTPRDSRRLTWNRNRELELFEAGYCLTEHSWFTVVTTCDGAQPGSGRAPTALR